MKEGKMFGVLGVLSFLLRGNPSKRTPPQPGSNSIANVICISGAILMLRSCIPADKWSKHRGNTWNLNAVKYTRTHDKPVYF